MWCLFDPTPSASNWLECLPAGSISTWEDLTTHFLAHFFPLRRTSKLQNDILMFQQHQRESLSEAWTYIKDLLQKVLHHGINLWLQIQIFYDHVNPATRRAIDQSAGGELHDKNAKESWALLEDLALYDNESWNDPRDFAKPVKAISLPQDVPSTSDLNKIGSSCEICSGPRDTQYCLENPEQAFVDYTSSRTDEAKEEGKVVDKNIVEPNESDVAKHIEVIDRKEETEGGADVETIKFFESSGMVPRSSDTEFVCTKEDDGDVMFIEIIKKYDDSHEEELEVDVNAMTEGLGVEYFDTFPTRSELAYHKNEEDKRRGVEYVMNKILGFYKECLELGPEYLTEVADEKGVMLYLMRRSLEVLREFPDDDSWITI
ncbi:MAK10-like protein [Tanacetum coccineum]